MKPVLKNQKGGFALGLILGLLLGLAVALAVALYVTKTPMPLLNKGQVHTSEQDAAEAERNKNWDPNAGLIGRPTTRAAPVPPPAVPGADGGLRPPVPAAPTAADSSKVESLPGGASASAPARSGRDMATVLSGPATPENRPVAAGDGDDPFLYFVQVGAYSRQEDAEQQRARLALAGFRAAITEREQNGRTVHRVRLGPFEKKDDADALLDRAKSVDPDATLVRIERSKQ